jgi:hypothetical protein
MDRKFGMTGTVPTPKINRVEVIDQTGRIFVMCDLTDVQVSVQDDGQTLKVFCKTKETLPSW